MVEVEIKIEAGILKDPKALSPVQVRLLGLELSRLVVLRTGHQGLDSDDKQLKPYSPRYRRFRVSQGRTAEPNLTFHGRMLGALSLVRSSSDTALVGFIDARERQKALWNQARGRVFVPASTADVRAITKLVLAAFKQRNKI